MTIGASVATGHVFLMRCFRIRCRIRSIRIMALHVRFHDLGWRRVGAVARGCKGDRISIRAECHRDQHDPYEFQIPHKKNYSIVFLGNFQLSCSCRARRLVACGFRPVLGVPAHARARSDLQGYRPGQPKEWSFCSWDRIAEHSLLIYCLLVDTSFHRQFRA